MRARFLIFLLTAHTALTFPAFCDDTWIWADTSAPAKSANTIALERGIQLARKKDYEGAVEQLNNCTSFDSLNLEAVKTAASCYEFAEEYKQSIKLSDYLLGRASKAHPSATFTGSVYAIRAEAYQRLKKIDLALQDFHTAAVLDPTRANYYLYHSGDILLSAHRPQEAFKILNDAVAANKNDPFAYRYLGSCYMQLNRPEDAIKSLNAAIEIYIALRKKTPDKYTGPFVECYKRLVLAYKAAGKPDLARSTQKKLDEIGGMWNDTLFGGEPQK